MNKSTLEETKIVHTCCNMCVMQCPIDVHVKAGKVIDVALNTEHTIKHSLCPRSRRITDWMYAQDRLTEPMMKKKGKWQQVSWDEALDYVSNKLSSIKKKYGAKALAVHGGDGIVHNNNITLVRDFCLAYGTPNFDTPASLCMGSHVIGSSLTLHEREDLFPDFYRTKLVVVWGQNPQASYPPSHLAVMRAVERGAKLIVIDPKTIPIAKSADIHIRPRPGTDCALTLGFLNVIIGEKLYDEEFVNKWTIGFDNLAEHVKKYPPEEVAEITGVPADKIEEVARLYATSKPASILQGISTDHCINGTQTMRAIAIMIAITGNFDIPGGNVYVEHTKVACLGVAQDFISSGEAIGAKKFPLVNEILRASIPCGFLVDAIIDEKPYPIKAMIISGGNPVITWPNSNKVKKALKKLEFVMVLDLFMTETAKLADVVLPVCSFLEESRIVVYDGIPLQGFSNKAIEPVGNSKPEWWIWTELAKRMGYEKYFPYKSNDDVLETLHQREDLLRPLNKTAKEIMAMPGSCVLFQSRHERRYLKEGFNTPSGKVELYSETAKKYGYDPLPTFIEPIKPEITKRYPFIVTTGARSQLYTHSRYRNIESFTKVLSEPRAEINSSTAANMGIKEGDMVVLESPVGKIKMKATLTDNVLPQVIDVPNGWPKANVNELVDNAELDPMSGLPPFRTVPCKVIKA